MYIAWMDCCQDTKLTVRTRN